MSRRAVLTVVELGLVTAALAAAVQILDAAVLLPDPAWWSKPAMVAAGTLLALAAAATLLLLVRLAWLLTLAPRERWGRSVPSACAAAARWLLYPFYLGRWALQSVVSMVRRWRLRATLGQHAAKMGSGQ